jgi:glutathione S-transferase
MLRILGRETSINVRKVLWLADELGLPYEREVWGMPDRDPRVPEFLALNPNAQVPVIVEADGFVLWESGAILRYLARDSGTLWPSDPQQRAVADQWMTWQATELNAQWGYAVYGLLRRMKGYDDEARIADSLTRWAGKMAILDARLRDTGAHVAGDDFSVADIVMGLSLRRWYAIPRALPEFGNVRRYYDALKQRAAGGRYLRDELF